MTETTAIGIQVSGHRFLMRRMAHGLVRGDVRMLDDPLRAQSLSLAAGCVVAAIAVAVCAVLAFLQPRGDVGTAAIVIVRESGAVYVRIGDTMHPAMNLASARLITGMSDEPELVGMSALDRVERGSLVGIPGAPDIIAAPLGVDESVWSVCDDADGRTAVLVGEPLNLDSSRSALVTPRGESAATAYLLYDGQRARVDLRDNAVVRALKLDGVTPRPVSRTLLDALPEAPEIVAPSVPEFGTPSVLPGFPTGTVVRLMRADSAEYYVALPGGVQRIGEMAADLIRFTYALRRDIAAVAPGLIGNVPIVEELPVSTFPDHGGVAESAALCAQSGAVLMGGSSPVDDGRAVTLAQADESGPDVDYFGMPSGRSAYVRAVGVTGEGAATGARYFVDNSGVLFGIRDEDAAERLGLSGPVPAPWPLLAHLPRGPELSVQTASVRRDGVGPTP
ncbi:type VII secretion protein EccB, Actinobacterial [Mycolicibacterium rhodesiae NBB3]|uniref:Type VII secretion protein EccB, Actinobacterial n=1 Tax=Mycolicibacterium rhodesiae (strain NBB3) TaxID=710685 RepID=G8RNC3_MYCRN|nr:type VII secretion protein EccB [Mycolicibacterium rhodesiae]AEV71255.1 type VII secretion protein EccB, Actinobacterial [Mycolicibacterium rhodesiae NBB3]